MKTLIFARRTIHSSRLDIAIALLPSRAKYKIELNSRRNGSASGLIEAASIISTGRHSRRFQQLHVAVLQAVRPRTNHRRDSSIGALLYPTKLVASTQIVGLLERLAIQF